MRRCGISLLAVCLLASGAWAQNVTTSQVKASEDWLAAAIADPQKLPVVLNALLLTRDPDALPLMGALTRSEDKVLRLMGVELVGQIGGDDAGTYLHERLLQDSSLAIRANALIQLLRHDLITPEQLRLVLQFEDDEIRMNATDALIQAGHADWTKDVLTALAGSRRTDAAVYGQMALLGLGEQRRAQPIWRALVEADASNNLRIRTLDQARVQNVVGAMDLARQFCRPEYNTAVRVSAWQARVALASSEVQALAKDLAASDNPLFQVNLLRILTDQPTASQYLPALIGHKESIVARIAAFEQARIAGGQPLETAVGNVLAMGHPMVIEYVQHRMRQDIDANRPMQFYVKPMLALLHQAQLSGDRMDRRHELIARSVELLADSKDQDAIKGLWDILYGQYSTLQRLAAGALYRSQNDRAADLVGHLLNSPYSELRAYAAIVLARHGQARALPVLLDLRTKETTTPLDVLTMVNWYILQMSGQTKTVAQRLATAIR